MMSKATDTSKAAMDGTLGLACRLGALPHYTMEKSLAVASCVGEATKHPCVPSERMASLKFQWGWRGRCRKVFDGSLLVAAWSGETTKQGFA